MVRACSKTGMYVHTQQRSKHRQKLLSTGTIQHFQESSGENSTSVLTLKQWAVLRLKYAQNPEGPQNKLLDK